MFFLKMLVAYKRRVPDNYVKVPAIFPRWGKKRTFGREVGPAV